MCMNVCMNIYEWIFTYEYICIYLKICSFTKWYVFFKLINLFMVFLHTSMFLAYHIRDRTYIAEGLVIGYSMRLELTRVCSLNDFQLVMGSYRGLPLFFLECLYLRQLYPSLIFDMFLWLCVCMCVEVVLHFTKGYFSSVCVWVCILRIFVCVCVW